ncbi:enoyl-CoA hydratase-related protein [Ponticaulis profundi]|uniref:Enoyl-CoA hydratase-related protein n=1 Tax=Ponticaulis profundi TaxID=2665222 RepID=A0ABW1S7L7_9PROT
MTYEDILYEVDGPAAIITLNRPDKMNAYTARMGVEIAQAIKTANEDDSVRAIILTGAGKGFCGGADISAGAGAFDTSEGGAGAKNFGDRKDDAPEEGAGFVGALYNSKKPTIAAFNGAAVGVGITMALPTDIKIASAKAKFGFIFTRRGLSPEAASGWFLPQLVGLSQALRWVLTGRIFDAEEALKGGLISEITEPGTEVTRAKEIVAEIAENTAPVGTALARQMLWRFGSADHPFDLLKIDGPFALALGSSPDVREGVASFLEKRPPDFPGTVTKDMPKGYPWWE